jgi:hypothetical protein
MQTQSSTMMKFIKFSNLMMNKEGKLMRDDEVQVERMKVIKRKISLGTC